jgi:hypothetical protein
MRSLPEFKAQRGRSIPTANDRPVSNFDQFLVRLPIKLSSSAISQENLILRRYDLRRKELHMGILDDLLAGGQLQKQYKDFVDRYEQGDPSEGYSDQEVLKRYGEVSHTVPPDQYAQAAQEALGKLSPEDRAEFLKMLQERAAARGVKLPGKVASNPKDLGKVLTDLHEKPGQLRDILGGGQPQGQAPGSNPITEILKSPQAKAVLAGIAATVFKRVTQGSSRTA